MNPTNVISFKKKKFDKKYGNIFKKYKYYFIFVVIPLIIVSIFIVNTIMIDLKQ